MSPWAEIAEQISDTLGERFAPTARHGVGGGCINSAWCLSNDKQRFFVKLNRAGLRDMFAAEAEALSTIDASNTVRVPKPVCVGSGGDSAWLVLEHLDLTASGTQSAEVLGYELAAMHATRGECFGWHRDNTIGSTPQPNAAATDWVEFWACRRLGYQLELAAGNGYRGRLHSEGEKLLDRLPAFFSDYCPFPSLLHGDLWSGNVACCQTGEPVVFDPASYYGDREADLAMSELFGGFPERFYAAYESVLPLDPGYATRKHLYNLYHVLNHLNLFGESYRFKAESLIGELLAS